MRIRVGDKLGWGGHALDRALSAILLLTVLGALGALVYVLAIPAAEEKFTEFYLLGVEGGARDYPVQLAVGEEGKVVVGVINREDRTMTYRVEVRIGGVINTELGPLTLENDKQREETVSFVPDKAGDAQKVEFLLYVQGQSEIYDELHLWVNVQ